MHSAHVHSAHQHPREGDRKREEPPHPVEVRAQQDEAARRHQPRPEDAHQLRHLTAVDGAARVHRTVKRECVETATNPDICSAIAGAREEVRKALDLASSAEEAADSRNSELRAPDRDESTRLLTRLRTRKNHRWWLP